MFMYGIRDKELKWFESYLNNRTQFTMVNNKKSEVINNNFGVPQAYILGALLFITYINDMPNILDKCEIVMYADDTPIFAENDNEQECIDNMAHDIEKLNNWLKMIKLKLNENKTKIMDIIWTVI